MLHPIPEYFVENELRRCGMTVTHTSSNLMIPCPFHKEEHPSLSISLGDRVPVGVWQCFGCGESGTWNKLARCLGLRQWGKEDIDPFSYVIKTKVQLSHELKQDNLTLSDWTEQHHWKKYSASFLSRFGARLCYDSGYKSEFLYIPITYLKEMYGYCKVRLDPELKAPKYWFNKNLNKVLYPIDYIMKYSMSDCVVLVEGMADAFRLLSCNIPALALLGVSLTPFMQEQLESLAVQNIILCLDGDEPGRNAMLGYTTASGREIEGLALKLEKLGYNVRMLLLPEGTDPDDTDMKYVKALAKMVRKVA